MAALSSMSQFPAEARRSKLSTRAPAWDGYHLLPSEMFIIFSVFNVGVFWEGERVFLFPSIVSHLLWIHGTLGALRGVGVEPQDGLVAHGAHAANLQPLEQAPGRRKHSVFTAAVRSRLNSGSVQEMKKRHLNGISRQKQKQIMPILH